MNRRKRRIIACLLALTLVLSSGGISALAKEDTGSTGGTVSEEPQEKTGSQTSGQDTSVEENGGEATGEQPGSETSSETDQTQGETGTTTNGQPAENIQQTSMQVVGWNWIDEDGVLQNTENVWGLGVPGASEENPLTQDALLEMLPKEVELTLSDGSEKTAALTWDLSAIPAEGIWSGDVTVTATADGTYSFAEGTSPIEVKVELGGAETYDLSDHTVEGLSPQGTTINLFDYWTGQNGNEVAGDTNYGINQDRLLHFHSGNATQSPGAFNEWTGDGGGPRQGMVKDTLQNGYPELQQNGNLGINHDESLAYLFNGYDSETSGSNRVNGKDAYMDVDGLLQLDNDGYYYYNAAYQVTKNWDDSYNASWDEPRANFASANYAEYNESSNSFVLYEKGAVANTGTTSPNGQFFPFDSANKVLYEDRGNLQQYRNQTSASDQGLNHYFGLSMTSRFVQREGGTNDGKDVTYYFSGDDDVWVYIDGVLVGDLGGIHDACSFEINFRTGRVIVYDSQGGIVQNITLHDLYQSAGKTDATQWDGNTFKDNTYHTLNFFYLERGNNDSNMSLKFNLVTVPQSSVFKVDQAGEPVADAKFELYVADEKYNYSASDLICSGTTDSKGEFVFVDNEGYLISLEDLNSKGIKNMVLKETEAPSGYRKTKDVHLYFYKGNDNLVLLSENHWDTGAYASGNITVKADNEIILDNNRTVNLDNSGTLFAVVLQYTGSGADGLRNDANWIPIYGDPITGWHRVEDGSNFREKAISAAKNNLNFDNDFSFQADSSGAYSTTVKNVPGDIKTYYHMLGENEKGNTKYALAFFYTTASSIDGATADNTVLVSEAAQVDGKLERTFSVNLYVSNIKNNLYVQKLDDAGNPVSAEKGTATFRLIEAGGNGQYDPNGKVFDTKTTSDMTTPFPLTGGVQFTKIPNGEYYLVETEAPAGYKKSEKAIHVMVDDTGVYADAGVADDGVTVSRGVGSIVKSMVQFAADDMVDATLHDIQATLYTNASTSDPTQDLGWSMSNPEQTTHLQYLNTNKLLEYGPISDKFALTLSTDVGWSKLEIQQCMDHDDGTESPKQNIEGKDLVNLFSGTVIVGVENERIGGLTISKTVETDQGQTAPAEDDFTFTIAANASAVANKAYDSIHYAADGTETENQISFSAEGTEEVNLKNGESIYIHGLPIGTQFTVTEAENKDYETSVSVNSGQSTDTNAGSVTISNDDNAKIDFTNTYIPKGDFSFTKINQGSEKLSGAVFAIYQLDCNNAGEEGHSHSGELIEVENPNTGALPADETCWKQVGTAVTSGTDGKVEFTDIPIKDNTEYRLVEIKAPAGYTLPKGQWKVTYAEGKFTIEENSAVGNPPAYNKDDETIINYKPGELPFSGNTGILMFLLLGAILMGAGAGGTIWYQHTHRRRRSLR